MSGTFYPSPVGATTATFTDSVANSYCMACFDVKKENADLSSGDQGIGFCAYDTTDNRVIYDANFFGTVEATSDSEFKFLEDIKNNWDKDSGYRAKTSTISYSDPTFSVGFVSEPLDFWHKKNLGIKKGKSYWKCYIGQDDAPDVKDPFNHKFSLSKSTTDKAWRVDTSCIEDSASKILVGLVSLIGLLA